MPPSSSSYYCIGGTLAIEVLRIRLTIAEYSVDFSVGQDFHPKGDKIMHKYCVVGTFRDLDIQVKIVKAKDWGEALVKAFPRYWEKLAGPSGCSTAREGVISQGWRFAVAEITVEIEGV